MEINIQSLLESFGIVTILIWIIWGLKKQLNTINQTVEAQKKTLETMEKRVVETEKTGELYKNLFNEIPIAIDKYKEIIQKTKDSTIAELELATKKQNAELIKLKERELKRLKVEENIATNLSKDNIVINIQQNVENMSNVNVSFSRRTLLLEVLNILRNDFNAGVVDNNKTLLNVIDKNISVLKKALSEDVNSKEVTRMLHNLIEKSENQKDIMPNKNYNKLVENINTLSQMDGFPQIPKKVLKD